MYSKAIAGLALGVLLALAGLGHAQSEPTGTLLENADLQRQFAGGALLDVHDKLTGLVASRLLLAGGRAHAHWLRRGGGPSGADVGTWRIEGDSLCFKWKIINHGEESCLHAYQTGDNTYEFWRLPEEVYRFSFSLRK